MYSRIDVWASICQGVINGIGDKSNSCKGLLTINCASIHSDYSFETDAIVMNTLIKNLPSRTYNRRSNRPIDWAFIDQIALADPTFYVSSTIDVLLGAEVFSEILMEGVIRPGSNLPIAQHTRLGWVLSGTVKLELHCNVR